MYNIFCFILFFRITYDPFCTVEINTATFHRLGFTFHVGKIFLRPQIFLCWTEYFVWKKATRRARWIKQEQLTARLKIKSGNVHKEIIIADNGQPMVGNVNFAHVIPGHVRYSTVSSNFPRQRCNCMLRFSRQSLLCISVDCDSNLYRILTLELPVVDTKLFLPKPVKMTGL